MPAQIGIEDNAVAESDLYAHQRNQGRIRVGGGCSLTPNSVVLLEDCSKRPY